MLSWSKHRVSNINNYFEEKVAIFLQFVKKYIPLIP